LEAVFGGGLPERNTAGDVVFNVIENANIFKPPSPKVWL
jgi:hypothetical protein